MTRRLRIIKAAVRRPVSLIAMIAPDAGNYFFTLKVVPGMLQGEFSSEVNGQRS